MDQCGRPGLYTEMSHAIFLLYECNKKNALTKIAVAEIQKRCGIRAVHGWAFTEIATTTKRNTTIETQIV